MKLIEDHYFFITSIQPIHSCKSYRSWIRELVTDEVSKKRSIYIPWPFPPVGGGGVAGNTKERELGN